MLEQFQSTYATQKWVKWTTCLGVLTASALLFWFSGGFPPHVWRFLIQALPLVPRLWLLKGPVMLLPLAALLMLSFTLLFFWLILATIIVWMVKEHWSYLRERQRFEASLLKAQSLASSEMSTEQWWQEQTEPIPQVARKELQFRGRPQVIAPTMDEERDGVHRVTGRGQAIAPTMDEGHGRIVSTLDPPLPMGSYKGGDIPEVHQTAGAALPRPTPIYQPLEAEGYQTVGADLSCPAPIYRPLEQAMRDTTDALKAGAERHFKLTVGTGLDPGIKRKHKPNEDRLLAIQGTLASDTRAQPFGLFVIADGIGGHANGQEASRLAIQTIRDVVIPALLSDVKINDEQSADLLMEAVQEANRYICEYNQMYKTDTGSTVTAALIVGETIAIANVGDSRTYIYSQRNGLTRVTRDHSVVARMVENGTISAEDVYIHPRRNEIYRSLGHKVALDVDMYRLPFETETTLLLCSDGLWEMVRDPHIQEILNSTLPHSIKTSKALVQAALDGGGQDNISVIVAHIT
jgi:serine/threonine protein phosphatase PrpC